MARAYIQKRAFIERDSSRFPRTEYFRFSGTWIHYQVVFQEPTCVPAAIGSLTTTLA
jgi:hypothetical protein